MMDEDTIKSGLIELDHLASAEYHQTLSEVLGDPDRGKTVARLGRLVGVLIKQPFANCEDLTTPSPRTGAYRAWHLKSEVEFSAIAAANLWQGRVLDVIRSDRGFGSVPLYQVAQHAHHESGFFGLYAQSLRKYICGDKHIRKKVDDAFKAYAKMGGSVKAPTPESIVGAGGLTLGVYLVQAVPPVGLIGAPGIAAVVLILYVLGVNAFCQVSPSGPDA
jgi:endonuclease G, mitochondrial